MSNFIPADFQQPAVRSAYFRPEKNKPNRVRILSDAPLCGYIRWTEDKRPVRWSYKDRAPEATWDADSVARSFFAVAVWNYETEQVQVWEITQRSLQESLEQLTVDPDFGHPINYDLKIVRSGEGLETKYQMMPISCEMKEPVQEALANLTDTVDLTALFRGDDPFA